LYFNIYLPLRLRKQSKRDAEKKAGSTEQGAWSKILKIVRREAGGEKRSAWRKGQSELQKKNFNGTQINAEKRR
ncbi:MAG: hypothetical protein ACP5Q3_12260, partial [bacterium]